MLIFNSFWFSELMHRNIHRTGQMLSLPKFFYQRKWLSSPWSHQVDVGIHGQESAIPKQCQGLPVKPGKLGRCGSEWVRATRKYAWSYWKHQKGIQVLLHPSKGPHLHRGSSQPHQSPSCANNLLCPWGVCETHSNPAVYFSMGRLTTVFTANHHAEFAQEEKEDMTLLIHIHL